MGNAQIIDSRSKSKEVDIKSGDWIAVGKKLFIVAWKRDQAFLVATSGGFITRSIEAKDNLRIPKAGIDSLLGKENWDHIEVVKITLEDRPLTLK